MDKSLGDEATQFAGNGESLPDLLPGDVVDRYRVIRLLGRGGMGQVYEVEHGRLGTRHALKIVPHGLAGQRGFIERFEREARVMANLDHPGIVRVRDFACTDGRYWLQMDLVKGVPVIGGQGRAISLADLAAANEGKLDQALFADLLCQVLEALAYAHGMGTVHRDLKPGNILLDEEGDGARAKISDFGLVRLVGEEWLRSAAQRSVSASLGATPTDVEQGGESTRSLLGTYAYMSPEQKVGGEVDARADLYALGLMTARLLTGKLELGYDLPTDIAPDLHPAWDDVVRKALSSRIERRYQSSREMREAVAAIPCEQEPAAPEDHGAAEAAPPETGAQAGGDGGPPPSEPGGTESDTSPAPDPAGTSGADERERGESASGEDKGEAPEPAGTDEHEPGDMASGASEGEPPEPLEREGASSPSGVSISDESQAGALPSGDTSAAEARPGEPVRKGTRPVLLRLAVIVCVGGLVVAVAHYSIAPGAWSFLMKVHGTAREANSRQKEAEKQVAVPKGWSPKVKRVKVATPMGEREVNITYYTNSLGMQFVLIPAGEFRMGSEEAPNEKPVHRVRIAKAFYMQAHEVTQRQWEQVMGNNPSHLKGANRPAEQVSWNDAQAFIKKLNGKERPAGAGYRLPTEAEWEYACRAGSRTGLYSGEEDSPLDRIAWYTSNSGGKAHEVGQKFPNALGLYDMSGNVWEWCQSLHKSYPCSSRDGREDVSSGGSRVLRGGSWFNNAWGCRSAYRNNNVPAYTDNSYGFRVAVSSPPQE